MIRDVINNKLCCGCGMCASVCPRGAIKIRFEKGMYEACVNNRCTNCGVCTKVCPVCGNEPKELLGHSLDNQSLTAVNCSVSYVQNESDRLSSASGGFVTAFLCHLMNTHKIDGAIVVLPVGENEQSHVLFKPVIARSIEEIKKASGTKYYPVEYSEVLKELRADQIRKVAVVGLPCVVSGIRSIMKINREYADKIRFVIGLTCGHMVASRFTDVLRAYMNVPCESKASIAYRVKSKGDKANNFKLQIHEQGYSRSLLSQNSPYSCLWTRRIFVPRCCDFCSDVFASLSDVSCMDAWLAEYMSEYRGTSLLVSRKKEVDDIIDEMRVKGLINNSSIQKEKVIESQKGVIRYKRVLLSDRIYRSRRLVQKVFPGLMSLCRKSGIQTCLENVQYRIMNSICETIWSLPFMRAHHKAKYMYWFLCRIPLPITSIANKVIDKFKRYVRN